LRPANHIVIECAADRAELAYAGLEKPKLDAMSPQSTQCQWKSNWVQRRRGPAKAFA